MINKHWKIDSWEKWVLSSLHCIIWFMFSFFFPEFLIYYENQSGSILFVIQTIQLKTIQMTCIIVPNCISCSAEYNLWIQEEWLTRGNIITRSSGNVKTHHRNLQKCTSFIYNTCISKVLHLVQYIYIFLKLNQQSLSYLYRSIRKTTHPNLIDHSKYYFTWKHLLYCY